MSDDASAARRPVVAMMMFPGLTHIDVVGPHAVWGFDMDVHLVWKNRDPIVSDTGVVLTPTTTMAQCPRDVDVLMIPGGAAVKDVMADREVVDWIAEMGARARYVTSVCTGSLLLGAAGLLHGYRAATHWTARELLGAFGAQNVVERVVLDRNRITGGGATAGMDFGLVVAAELVGEERARTIQLMLEYDPEPPFDAGVPERASARAVAEVRAFTAEANREIVETTARILEGGRGRAPYEGVSNTTSSSSAVRR